MESVSLPSWLLAVSIALTGAAAFLLGRFLRAKRPPFGGVRPLALSSYDAVAFLCFLIGGSLLGGFWFSGLALAGVVLFWGRQEGVAGIERRLGTLPIPKALGFGLCIAMAIALPLQCFSSGLGVLFHRLHLPVPLEPAVQLLEEARHPLAIAWLLGAALFLAPLAEEALFRGFLQPVLKAYFDTAGPRRAASIAIGGSALAFAALHGHALTFLPLCAMGVVLGLVYEWSGSLLLCIAVHFWFNLFTALVLLSGRLP